MQSRKVYGVALALIASVAAFAIWRITQQRKPNTPSQQEVAQVAAGIADAKPDAESVHKAVEKFKNLAEHFEPKSTKEQVIPSLPKLDTELMAALDKLATSGSREHLKYLALIILKLNRFYYENFHQDYDLRDNVQRQYLNPKFLEEYCRLTQLCNEHDEMIGSGVGYAWVEKNPELLEYKPIQNEIERTDRVVDAYNKKMEALLKKSERGK